MDPIVLLATLFFAAAIFGLGFTSGRNHPKREERIRMALRERYR